MNYRIVALSDQLASEVRRTGKAPKYGHPTTSEVAKGYGPCRQCLRTFAIGEERRILFTYDAFQSTDTLPLPGPVFIHESPCERYAEEDGFPYALAANPLTLLAYAPGSELRAQKHVTDGQVDAVIDEMLRREDVEYIHVRDTRAGCFDFAIVR